MILVHLFFNKGAGKKSNISNGKTFMAGKDICFNADQGPGEIT